MAVNADDPLMVISMVHLGDPLPCPRPRMVNGHVYTSSRYLAYRDGLAWAMRAAVRRRWLTGPMALEALFVRGNDRACDLDNLLKTLMDAATAAGVWADDVQVVELSARKTVDKKNPRTEVTITRCGGS